MEKGGIIIGAGHVLGVAVETGVDGTEHLRYVHLHRHRRQVDVVSQGTVEIADVLAGLCGTRIPVSLAFNTGRCLHRVLDREGESEELMRHAFPGLDMSAMLTAEHPTGSQTGISAMRRSDAAEIITALKGSGFRIVDLHIGPWCLLALRDIAGSGLEAFESPGHQFQFREGKLISYGRIPFELAPDVLIGSDHVKAENLLAFASAWSYLVPTAESITPQEELVIEARREERARIWYEYGLVIACATLLLLFAGERLLNHWSQGQEQGLRVSMSDQQALDQQLERGRKTLTRRRDLSAQMGLNGSGTLAAHAAILVENVPVGITLDRLSVYPLTGALKENQLPTIDKGRIRIHGTCVEAALLNSWMQDLGTLSDMKGVRLLSYTLNERDGVPHFELEIDT